MTNRRLSNEQLDKFKETDSLVQPLVSAYMDKIKESRPSASRGNVLGEIRHTGKYSYELITQPIEKYTNYLKGLKTYLKRKTNLNHLTLTAYYLMMVIQNQPRKIAHALDLVREQLTKIEDKAKGLSGLEKVEVLTGLTIIYDILGIYSEELFDPEKLYRYETEVNLSTISMRTSDEMKMPYGPDTFANFYFWKGMAIKHRQGYAPKNTIDRMNDFYAKTVELSKLDTDKIMNVSEWLIRTYFLTRSTDDLIALVKDMKKNNLEDEIIYSALKDFCMNITNNDSISKAETQKIIKALEQGVPNFKFRTDIRKKQAVRMG